jgi:hypothetical protein
MTSTTLTRQDVQKAANLLSQDSWERLELVFSPSGGTEFKPIVGPTQEDRKLMSALMDELDLHGVFGMSADCRNDVIKRIVTNAGMPELVKNLHRARKKLAEVYDFLVRDGLAHATPTGRWRKVQTAGLKTPVAQSNRIDFPQVGRKSPRQAVVAKRKSAPRAPTVWAEFDVRETVHHFILGMPDTTWRKVPRGNDRKGAFPEEEKKALVRLLIQEHNIPETIAFVKKKNGGDAIWHHARLAIQHLKKHGKLVALQESPGGWKAL